MHRSFRQDVLHSFHWFPHDILRNWLCDFQPFSSLQRHPLRRSGQTGIYFRCVPHILHSRCVLHIRHVPRNHRIHQNHRTHRTCSQQHPNRSFDRLVQPGLRLQPTPTNTLMRSKNWIIDQRKQQRKTLLHLYRSNFSKYFMTNFNDG